MRCSVMSLTLDMLLLISNVKHRIFAKTNDFEMFVNLKFNVDIILPL